MIGGKYTNRLRVSVVCIWRGENMLSGLESLFGFGLASCQSFCRHAPSRRHKSLWEATCLYSCNLTFKRLNVPVHLKVISWQAFLMAMLASMLRQSFGGDTLTSQRGIAGTRHGKIHRPKMFTMRLHQFKTCVLGYNLGWTQNALFLTSLHL